MIRFDQALDTAARFLLDQLPSGVEATLIRAVSGSLTAVVSNGAFAEDKLSAIAEDLHSRLGRYSPGAARVLLREMDLVDPDDVLGSPDRVPLADYRSIFLVDRLLTNQDWLRQPLVATPIIPTATAFSIKGGVGRSTAVAVWAWHLARLGKRALVIDLDLEAPGVGNLLLSDLPDYGLVDWLVESLVEQGNRELLSEMIGSSPVADDAPGIIQVIPAFGAKTREYVSKVGRVYMPSLGAEGKLHGIASRLNELIKGLAAREEPPEVVLLDARAGIHDVGAAAVTQLGAEVFLFARDDHQTWEAYAHLFDHLRHSRAVEWGMPDNDLRWRLKMVAAQIDPEASALSHFVDVAYERWSELYDDEEEQDDSAEATTVSNDKPQVFARGDLAAPHTPFPIVFDSGMRGLHLASPDRRPDWRIIEAAFGEFLRGATARLLNSEESQ